MVFVNQVVLGKVSKASLNSANSPAQSAPVQEGSSPEDEKSSKKTRKNKED